MKALTEMVAERISEEALAFLLLTKETPFPSFNKDDLGVKMYHNGFEAECDGIVFEVEGESGYRLKRYFLVDSKKVILVFEGGPKYVWFDTDQGFTEGQIIDKFIAVIS